LRVVSLIAIVPDSECRTPILIVPWVWATAALAAPAITAAASAAGQILFRTLMSPLLMCPCAALPAGIEGRRKIEAKPR
jgi:hypothetical protein